MRLDHYPVAREAGTYKDMVRELSNTNFTDVEDEAKYWLQHYDAETVECAVQDAGYGAPYAARVLADVLGWQVLGLAALSAYSTHAHG